MRHLFILLLIAVFFNRPCCAQGPTLDPAFAIGQVFAPSRLFQVVQQADGKRLLVGTFTRVGGADVMVSGTGSLARLLASSTQLDAPFQANVAGLHGSITRVLPLANGQLLVLGWRRADPLQLGGISRVGLLRLNADGTPDPSFAPSAAPPTLVPQSVVEQPNGQLVVAGLSEAANGTFSPVLVRLNADGTLDPSFQPLQSGGINAPVNQVLLQPDGAVLIGGTFTTVQGQLRRALARLLPTGALDAGFNAALPVGTQAGSLALQPDGNLLALLGGNGSSQLRRLLPTGGADATWQTGTGFSGPNGSFFSPLALQADGHVVVATSATRFNGAPIGRLIRLLSNGALDASFSNQLAAPDLARYPVSLQALPNGQVLAAGPPVLFGNPAAQPVTLAVFSASGAYLPAATPTVQQPGSVLEVVRQPNGQLLVGGDFNEINGQAAGYVARLNANGTPDATFTTACNGVVNSLALQPDGKVLLGGHFGYVAGVARTSLARLLPAGTLDAGFAPALQPIGNESYVQQVAVQPDGNVLLAGYFNLRPGPAARPQVLARVLGTTGQRDNTFVPADSTGWFTLLVQADGRILVGGSSRMLMPGATNPVLVWRLLASGALDYSYQLTPVNTTGNPVNNQGITPLATDASGRLYVGGKFSTFGTVPTRDVARLLPNGAPDASFGADISGLSYNVSALAVQPNGRVLVGAALFRNNSYQGLTRLLDSGSEDLNFLPGSGPSIDVVRLLVQPDGGILVAGTFEQVSGLPVIGLTRLLDANVLGVAPTHSIGQLEAWPVPAHGTLHLRLDAAARPQRVRLLDALGRTVLTQPASPSDLTLETTSLPTGVYLVLVEYAAGVATRRIVLE